MTQKLNGNQIQKVIKTSKNMIAQLYNAFNESIYAFESDKTARNPDEVFKEYKELAEKIAKYSTLQDEYNQRVKVKLDGEVMTLSEVLIRLPTAGTMSKMWSNAAAVSKTLRRGYIGGGDERDPTKEYKVRMISQADANLRYLAAEDEAAALRALRTVGNLTEVTVDENLRITD